MTKEAIQVAGEYVLDTIKLLSSTGQFVDLKSQVASIDIYENIFTSSIAGSITFAETYDLMTNFPIVGQEFLELKLRTPGFNNQVDIIDFVDNPLSVYKIQQRNDVAGDAKLYQLAFTSPELLKNYRTRLSQSYEGQTSDIVKTILTSDDSIGTKKNIHLENTVGLRKFISPNLHPYTLIKKLTKESLSSNSNSPHYLFFENTKGFHFRTLQSLYGRDSVRQLHSGETGLGDHEIDLPHEFERLLSYGFQSNNDMLKSIMGGMLGSKLITHDIYKKQYKINTFNYIDEFGTYGRVENNPNRDNPVYSDQPIDKLGNDVGDFPDSVIHLQPTSTVGVANNDAQHYNSGGESNYSSNKYDSWMFHREQRLTGLENCLSINAAIYGDTSMSAGDMIDINLPSVSANNTENTEAMTSGKYLITALRHNFVHPVSQGGGTHTIYLEAVRDSIPFKIPSAVGGALQPQSGNSMTINVPNAAGS